MSNLLENQWMFIGADSTRGSFFKDVCKDKFGFKSTLT